MSIAWTATTDEMAACFTDAREVQAWLDVEAALARAEARLGLVPSEAAEQITARARVDEYDLDALRAEIRHAVHPVMPLVRALADRCAGGAGEYVHWGATTQDVLDTGLVLRLAEAEELLSRDLARLIDILEGLARAHRGTPMAGRTHGQQAVPITFGYKVAVWVDELRRHARTLASLRTETFVVQFGGAAGTLASLGPVGLEVRAALADELDLGEALITWHTSRDRAAHLAFVVAMVAGAVQRAAAEVVALQRTEVGEVAEPAHAGKVGSSTMPHKHNPATCEAIWTLGELVLGDVRTGLSGFGSLHERDKAVYTVDVDYLPRVFGHTHRMLELATEVFAGLTVDRGRMRANLDASRGGVFSERAMMVLADRIGRQRAHDLVSAAARSATDHGGHLRDALHAHPEVATVLGVSEIDGLFDPEPLTEAAVAMVDRVCPPSRSADEPATTG
ncbi:adenylosuccinate lyase family protein [Egibacter rhizosphaerae]|uniref:Adenylosuccinate lyase family protein n=1 Tax=Egibacter rhizosphaerae TaxID=1670831 RepID=A0A411YH05_9ACTN|nr:adenylosuccinate lyase family protein [Egibacter rhizosphaerae]QBI20487.1 adenylosuccinate lyase family protein [Egibacter rhizosphaerae]